MRLVDPTDFEILQSLADGKRNTAANIAVELEKDRGYINTRLPQLVDYELVQKVGPAPNSGLYVITDLGRTAVTLYAESESSDEIENQIEQQRIQAER